MRRTLPSLAVVLALAGCNQPPEGLAVSIAPDAPRTADDLTVVIDSEAVDPNGGDTVSYKYEWIVDEANTDNEDATLPWSETRKGQTWRVEVTPADGRISGTTATAEVTIGNTLPTATVSLSPAAPTTDDRLELDIDTQDVDSEVVSTEIQWLVDGVQITASEERLPATFTSKGQVWEAVVTPSDSEGAGEPARVAVTIGNSTPEVASAAVSPAMPDRSTVAECIGTGWSDADDDVEGYEVSWSVDGAVVADTATLALAPYARGSRLSCTLTPFDGDDRGEPRTSREVTIGNAPPSIGSVVIGPDGVKTGTDVTATLTDVVDADGDDVELAYSWRVNGVERSTQQVLAGGRFIRDQDIVLVVTPSDAFDVGVPVISNLITSSNSPPVVTSVTLSPTDPRTDAVVTATVVTDDADGDAVTVSYAWYVEGALVSPTGDTLDGATWFDKHDEVYVIVTPSDADAGAAETSASLFVANTPPPAPKLVFDPEEPAADEDVQCVIDAQDPDADADAITYTFGWTVNGTAFTGATTTTHTGDTVPYGDRAEDDEWICIVTPNDGEDDGDVSRRVLGNPPPIAVDYTGTLATTALRGGSMPGTTYNEDCAAGEVLVGMSFDLTKTGGYLASLAPRCAELELTYDSSECTVETGTVTTGTYRGGSGTVIETSDCAEGSVVTGFVGRAGWYIDQLALRCHPVEISFDGEAWVADLGTHTDLSAVGGTGGSAFSRTDCATGKVATRATIRAAGQVDGFQLGCQDPELVFE